jgi:hypothetical protein
MKSDKNLKFAIVFNKIKKLIVFFNNYSKFEKTLI